MDIYSFVLIILLILILTFIVYQLILLNKSKDELIKILTVSVSDALAFQDEQSSYYEEEDTESTYDPHESMNKDLNIE